MKVYALPEEVPAPETNYMNYDRAKEDVLEAAHRAALKSHFISMGYTGKNTGRVLRIGHADGYAQYMYIDGPGGRAAGLVNLPYGDAWDSPMARGLAKAHVLKMLDEEDRRQAFWAKKTSERIAKELEA